MIQWVIEWVSENFLLEQIMHRIIRAMKIAAHEILYSLSLTFTHVAIYVYSLIFEAQKDFLIDCYPLVYFPLIVSVNLELWEVIVSSTKKRLRHTHNSHLPINIWDLLIHIILNINAIIYSVAYIIVRLQNTGIYRIYNPKALGCGARAKQGHY